MSFCKKCKNQGSIILRKHDTYCDECFITNINHKFRACIGKNKILRPNSDVLLCINREKSSSVLLDLTQNGIAIESPKKLRITPHFLHVIDLDPDLTMVNNIVEQCQKYKSDIYTISITEYVSENITLQTNGTYKTNDASVTTFVSLLKGLSETAKKDFITKVKRSLFVRIAKILNCQYIFKADNTTSLAINLLSNIALGRGSQVENDIGFYDNRDTSVKLLRPMKDITDEELQIYISKKNLQTCDYKKSQVNSLQFIIANFVTDLQENYPATVSTVSKTADKIGNQINNDLQCIMCKSIIYNGNLKLSAMDATNFSRVVSYGQKEETNTSFSINLDQSIFPHVNEKLCYNCSRNYSEMNQNNINIFNILKIN